MPWLPLYLYGNDPDTLLAMLNDDPEVAFLVSDGPSRWKAVATLAALTERRYAIWHVPSGPLPLLPAGQGSFEGMVIDPWSGWTEKRTGADPSAPYLGAGHPGIIWLNLKNHSQANERLIGLSSFEWIGHRYATVGHPVEPATERWWKRFGASVRRSGSKVPRDGPTGNLKPEIYALCGALRAFDEGRGADANP